MSETIIYHDLSLAGETGLKLYLRKNDGTLLNTGGDAFTDLGSAGVFTATLAESRGGLGTLHARVCDGTETADNSVFEEFLPESETVIGASGVAVRNTATQGQSDARTRGLIAGGVGSILGSGLLGGSGMGGLGVGSLIGSIVEAIKNPFG